MNTKLITLVLAALLTLPASGIAASPNRVLEDGSEVRSTMLTLPATAGGIVAIQGCATCKRRTLRLAPTARFFIGRTEVAYLELQRHLSTYPGLGVLVVSPRGQNVITRITASAAGAQ
jgi:hypothetical protein